MLLAALVLALLGGTTAVSLLRPGLAAVGAVAASGLAWWLVNGPLEGPVLWRVSAGHGLTVADLLTPVALAVALVRVGRAARPRTSHG